tara:strand:+ start:617 stop:1525 length:909 start_codon:yes stop_codon:yes gene_type:complete
MKTILRYAGGKSKGAKYINPLIAPYDNIVSPFMGGGSLEVGWATSGKEVRAYDIFDILVNFWNVLLDSPDKLATELAIIKPTPAEYKRVKEELMKTPQVQAMLQDWKTEFYKREPVTLTNLKLAAYYYFNHNCSYGPGFLGWASKIYMKQEKWDRTIDKIRTFKCDTLEVGEASFEDVIEDNKKSFLYLDPPYCLNKDSTNKMFKGIYPMRNIPVHHDGFPHEKLRDLLHSHAGDFVLSYNDCTTIREWYSDFEILEPRWHYSMSLGEKRIGKNRLENPDQFNEKGTKTSHELLIVKRRNKK